MNDKPITDEERRALRREIAEAGEDGFGLPHVAEKPLGQVAREAQEVAPGPWRIDGTHSNGNVFIGTDRETGIVEVRGYVGPDRCARPELAAFIAAASPDVVLALLAERDEARRMAVALAELRAVEIGQDWPCRDEAEELEEMAKLAALRAALPADWREQVRLWADGNEGAKDG